jgi:methyl-accepting chemotaxis protein
MHVMDLQMAIISHLNWKSKLSDFFYGVEDLTLTDVPDHVNCDFGKLLYATGLKYTPDFPEIKTVELIHKEVHNGIRQLVMMPKKTRKSTEGKQALEEFKIKCDSLVNLLENLETQLKRR